MHIYYRLYGMATTTASVYSESPFCWRGLDAYLRSKKKIAHIDEPYISWNSRYYSELGVYYTFPDIVTIFSI